jgi:hypothetical protein
MEQQTISIAMTPAIMSRFNLFFVYKYTEKKLNKGNPGSQFFTNTEALTSQCLLSVAGDVIITAWTSNGEIMGLKHRRLPIKSIDESGRVSVCLVTLVGSFIPNKISRMSFFNRL